ncbi:MAG: hypothetical protein E6H58_11335 [Betaproteobacteria bacterium]|nr:MAG: hypothetical protein E6H58_11335 [Betaproteobacteria bacterium]
MTAHRFDVSTPAQAMRHRLLARVQASHEHESQFLTVRRDAVPWQPLDAQSRMQPLAQTVIAMSSLVDLSRHARLPPPRGAYNLCEWVVLEGSATLVGQALACGDAARSPNDDMHAMRAGADGARLYLRCSRVDDPPAEVLRVSTLDDTDWDDFCPGVRIKALWEGGARRTVLVRMRAGASVKAHAHALEEECMMLAGEAFIGDTLLRSGEYQLAPQGSRHGEVSTDVGAVFFVHGSLDPAAYA